MARRKAKRTRRAKRGPFPNIPMLTNKGKISIGGIGYGNAMVQITTGWGIWNPKGTGGTGSSVAYFNDTIHHVRKGGKVEEVPGMIATNAKNSVLTWGGFQQTWGTAIVMSWAGKSLLSMAPGHVKRYVTA